MNIKESICKLSALFAVIMLCSGFSWGLGKSDPCGEARAKLSTLRSVSDPDKRVLQENSILKACPDDASGLYIKGLQADRASRTDAAITLYRSALANDDTITEAHGNLGLLLLNHGFEKEASVELTRGLMGLSDPRYHRAIAHIMQRNGLFALALFHYNEAWKAFPDDIEILKGRAEAYVQLRQFDKAEKEYARLRIVQPDEMKIRLSLADTYRKSGNLDQAVAELQSCLRDNPSDKEVHRLLAEVLMEKGEKETARREYLLAGVDLIVNPEDFARKGEEYMKLREYGQAISAYRTALKGRPDWQEIQYKLGKAQMAAGRDDDAMVTFMALVKTGFKDSSVYYDLGLLHERSGQLDDAIANYRLSIARDPADVNAQRRLAEIYSWRGSFTESAEQYQKLIRLRGDNPLLHLNLGRVYGKMREYKNAVSEYETAVRLDPNSLEGHRELARLFMHEGQSAKAEQHFKKVLDLFSEDETARNALITLYVKQKRYDELTMFVKDWLGKAPDDPQRHYRLGIVYEFKKEYNQALTEYKKAIELKPNNAKMLLALGRTYMKAGYLAESREFLEAASTTDPTLVEAQLLLSSIKRGLQPAKKQLHKRKKKISKKKPSRKQ